MIALVGCSPAPEPVSVYQAQFAVDKQASPRTSGENRLECEVDLPGSWEKFIAAGSIPTQVTAGQVLPASVGADGSAIFGQLNAGKYEIGVLRNTEIVRFDGQKRTWSTVYRMEDPSRDQQVGGSFDGRWFVFAVQHSLMSYETSIRVWDQETDITRQLDDGFVDGVDTRSGKAIWSKGVDRDVTEVCLYDLKNDEKTVVARGRIRSTWIIGDLIVRTEGQADGSLDFRAAALASGKPVETPQGLRDIEDVGPNAASGSVLAWIEGGFRTVRAWKVGWDEPRTVFDEGRDKVDGIGVSGDLVSWHPVDSRRCDPAAGIQPVYVADVRSGTCVRLTKELGYVSTNEDAMVVVHPDSSRQKFHSFLMRPSQLPPLPTR
ncbi:hypothetical protein [Rhizohabitans arisaemae]|uniref:hypothetical protein n=1 Tax=Rhizohabitans arisaemae TaxID=2720610 RepID=UPI0024B03BC1|nr:hypothetical protein [Rhizohabitans arisaemae]